MSKTETIFNIMGWRLDDDPAPILYIGPTEKLVTSMSTDRVMKMFESAPSLWEKLVKGKRNKVTEKFIAGVRLGFGWAGSATELAGHPAALVLLDERDRMADDTGREGDPVELAEARIATYPDGKIIIASTPTTGHAEVYTDAAGYDRWDVSEAVQSPVWKLWQEGTRHEWAWPCPECGEYFVPRFRLLRWPAAVNPTAAAKAARLECPHCGHQIPDTAKGAMNARGRYLAPGQHATPDGTVHGPVPDNDTASYWVSGLCSPWRTFGQRARSFLAAQASGDQTRVQTVVNTGFGELYAVRGEVADWRAVAALKQPYSSGEVPAYVIALVAGVDVQANRLVYGVRGFGLGLGSALIEHGELWGDTAQPEVWQRLAVLLAERWGPGELPIRVMCIDSGYRAAEVYAFCRRYPQARPTKGRDAQIKPIIPSRIDITVGGKTLKQGIILWHLDSDYFKSWVHARLDWPADQPGAWALPEDVTDSWCKQIVAESKITLPSGKAQWVRASKENHALDVEALCAAGAMMLQIHRMPAPAPAAQPVAASSGALAVPAAAPRRRMRFPGIDT